MNRKVEIYYPEDSVLNISTKPTKHLKKDYARCFLYEMETIASSRDLNATDLRVLIAIIGNLGYENILNISQKDLANKLKVQRPEITKSIKKLISKKYLQIIDKIGRQNIYQFNPNIAFRSRAKNHKNLCNDWEEDIFTEEINSKLNLNKDLEIKFQEKINEISKKFNIGKNKAKEIMLFLINQGLNKNSTEDNNLPY